MHQAAHPQRASCFGGCSGPFLFPLSLSLSWRVLTLWVSLGMLFLLSLGVWGCFVSPLLLPLLRNGLLLPWGLGPPLRGAPFKIRRFERPGIGLDFRPGGMSLLLLLLPPQARSPGRNWRQRRCRRRWLVMGRPVSPAAPWPGSRHEPARSCVAGLLRFQRCHFHMRSGRSQMLGKCVVCS